MYTLFEKIYDQLLIRKRRDRNIQIRKMKSERKMRKRKNERTEKESERMCEK